ncbi:MAG: hypothetical protein ACLQVA_12920 [Candidatus Brocadiia bacterium]
MIYKLIGPLVIALSLLPMTVAGSTAPPAGQPIAQGFKILLTDGSILRGAVSFTMDIDSQYGRLTIPSANFLAAHFNLADEWADIYTKSIELRVKYKASTSDLKATTDAGPISVDLSKVVSIETLYAEAPNAAPPVVAANPGYQEAPPAAPADVYADQTPYDYADVAPYINVNPAYVSPGPYGGYGYDYGGLYGYPLGYSYAWCPGYGFIACGNFNGGFFGRGFGNQFGNRFGGGFGRGFHNGAGGFGGGFHNAAAGRGFSSFSFRGGASPAIRSGGGVFRSAASSGFRSGGTSGFHGVSHASFGGGGARGGAAGGRGR